MEELDVHLSSDDDTLHLEIVKVRGITRLSISSDFTDNEWVLDRDEATKLIRSLSIAKDKM